MNNTNLAINTLRINGVAAVNKANSGHPGIVLGAAPIIHTLFTKHMKFDSQNPLWVNRDRFILSAGHGSALLYAQLRLLGLISEMDLKSFRQLKSKTPGHPELGHTKGVDSTTGPLGQGIAMAVGVAVAEESLRSRFKEIKHFTYVLCGDGDLQEGVSMESMSFAGMQQLAKLIVLHDSNDIQLDTPVEKVFKENLKMRMESIGWDYQLIKKNDPKLIDEAIKKAKISKKPSFIEIKTIIGEGATKQGTTSVHGAPLGDDFNKVKKYYKWDYQDFEIPLPVKQFYKKINEQGKKQFAKFKPSNELKQFLKNKVVDINIKIEQNLATRASSGEVIKYLNDKLPIKWIGGSADLVVSTKAQGGNGDFSPTNRKGRNILFGVREFGMSSIANGIAIHSKFRPFVSTFFVFLDYLKPALRLAALMKLPVTYVFTHDSVFVGEDGPTHEPIEQIAMLRATPNVNVIRPADEKEVQGAYEVAINSQTTPTAIILTRQNVVSLKNTSKNGVAKGAYKIRNATKSSWTLVASGSELANTLEVANELNLNVVSLVNSFNAKINWDVQKAISIEAGSTYGMSKFAKFNIGIDRFGESGNGKEIYKYLGLDKISLIKKIQTIINK